MKSVFYGSLLLLVAGLAQADEKVTTASGRVAILSDDGTWKYEVVATTAGNSGNARTRAANATTKVEIGQTGYSFYYDQSKWHIKSDESGKMTFGNTKGMDAYGVIIYERLQVPIDNLLAIALGNAKAAAPDAQITKQETKIVNGREVTAATISGTIEGIHFVYYSYYYSGKGGVVQVVTYTGANLLDEYRPELDQFLDGFVGGP